MTRSSLVHVGCGGEPAASRFIPGDENSIFNYGLHIGGYLPSHQKAAYPVSIPDLNISFESYALPLMNEIS